MKYLVYNNPEEKEVDFVRDTNSKPRIYDDLDLAEECANEQTNGYVVPLGWDAINFMQMCQDEEMPTDVQDEAEMVLNQL